jgi:hypothetical protein
MAIDWKRKLTSRKFWLAVIGLVSGLLMAFKVDGETVETISGVIMSAASVIAYIIGEGMADAANAEPVVMAPIFGEPVEDKEE